MQNNKGNIQTTSKYDEMLKQYNLDITDEEVKAAVKKIIEEKVCLLYTSDAADEL